MSKKAAAAAKDGKKRLLPRIRGGGSPGRGPRRSHHRWGKRCIFAFLLLHSIALLILLLTRIFPHQSYPSIQFNRTTRMMMVMEAQEEEEEMEKTQFPGEIPRKKDLLVERLRTNWKGGGRRRPSSPTASLSEREVLAKISREFKSAINREIERDEEYFNHFRHQQGNQTKILLASSWRSGSTFIADLLNQIPGTFYSFEPLMEGTLKNDTRGNLDVMSKVFNCDFSSHEFGEVSKWVVESHNFPLSKVCRRVKKYRKGEKNPCLDSQLLAETCRGSPVILAKTVRLLLRTAMELMKTDSRLKVIALFRDPRAVLNSRLRTSWCKHDQCRSPSNLCSRLGEDLSIAEQIKNTFPDRIFVVRYEDFCFAPNAYYKRLLTFLGFPPPTNYMLSHLKRRITFTRRIPGLKKVNNAEMEEVKVNRLFYRDYPSRNIFSKRSQKVTSSVDFITDWRRNVPFLQVKEIQDSCQESMKVLAYQVVHLPEKLRDVKNVKLLETTATKNSTEDFLWD